MYYLNDEDFVVYKNKSGGVESIGMSFVNLFRDNDMPAMVGGGIGSHNKFGNIGIPVGLYMMNRQLKTHDKKNEPIYNILLKFHNTSIGGRTSPQQGARPK